ncbi:sodium-dependent proline transporter-like [Gigantopelta aegis]|uniref:sodium-dependent proline transporter-like n=1 Tax=Gigantopelta aegis TaxID=1735272 RepID=UPI001B88992F|nr:sodium-dependent proline transporter-like [Gigantopelta aegis]XP_041373554.1 sodium-dependent proline transporter-like [Gigantopelta aegis]XP_041373556.1 sodium-dependent proline transporter-like [Gigantopelta aegis]
MTFRNTHLASDEFPLFDKGRNRDTWSHRFEFLLSCLSYAVGLGNVWRFPYVCYKNGGGAFLLPFLVMLCITGLPLVFLELAFGQFASEGVVSIWKISPVFKGVGWSMFIMSGLIAMYYNMIIAWSLHYLFGSFATVLPWSYCGSWGSAFCVEDRHVVYNCSHHNGTWVNDMCKTALSVGEEVYNCIRHNGTWFNSTCMTVLSVGEEVYNCSRHNGTWFNNTCKTALSVGEEEYAGIRKLFEHEGPYRSASDEYFHDKVLEMSDGLHEIGGIKMELAFYLLLAWIIVCICLARGIRTSGKAAYFTAFFPYVVMSILLIRGLMLEGSGEGLKYFVTPQWDKLGSIQVWGDAAVQVFFSLSPCWGGLITLASFNKFHNNCLNDAIIVSLLDCLTSIFAGLVIFTIIGYMAHELEQPIADVVKDGAGLAFVVYPEAVRKLPLSQFWSVIFFAMLFSLGLGTQIATVTTVHTTLLDRFPATFHNNPRKSAYLLLAIVTVCFCMGLTFCTRGGMYLLQLFDNYAASYSLLFIGIVELLAISWVYGAKRFLDDIQSMLGKRPSKIWIILWQYISPATLMVILVLTWGNFQPSSYGDVMFPVWADVLGWLISLLSMLPVPIIALYVVYKQYRRSNSTLKLVIDKMSKPSEDWGPRLCRNRLERDKLNVAMWNNTDTRAPIAVISFTNKLEHPHQHTRTRDADVVSPTVPDVQLVNV